MKRAGDQPRPLLRVVGERPEDGSMIAPVPWKIAVEIRDYAKSQGFAILKLERSRARISSSCYLSMRDPSGRAWQMRVSNHLRPRRTGYALPNLDFVTFDGVSGVDVGRGMIDRIVAGKVLWFDASTTQRCMPYTKRRKGVRQCRR